MDTQGNECVEAKEGTAYNLIEYNMSAPGRRIPTPAGLYRAARAMLSATTRSTAMSALACGLGGHLVDGVQYGVENEVYGNLIQGNDAGGVKILVDGQARVCGNQRMG